RLTEQGTMAVGDEAPLDTDYDNVWTGTSAVDAAAERTADAGFDGADLAGATPWGAGGRPGFDGLDDGIDQTLSGTPTLRQHLLDQVAVEFDTVADRLIASQLVDWLDENGWLTSDPDQIAEQIGCDRARIDRIVARLQGLDPTGVFARSLAECLGLQLAEKNRLDPAMQALLDRLPMLAKRDFAQLMRQCRVDSDDLAEMIQEIRECDPRPARRFEHEPVQTVSPDVLMRPQAGGGWTVELNPDTLPRVLINHRYYAEVTQHAKTKADKEYLGDCFATASWLVKSLHQRATTILKVATEIVRQQDAFFIHGVAALKPLILRDIAEAIGMHESTVSRVTSNKFMATPRGVFELKYFFTASIAGADGAAAHSAAAVRFRIKALIDGEPPDGILSDDRIVEVLRADGIDIARRTVAKYREGMRIPSSVQRRREKAIGA
ncbi:MAG: RNA polymerase factor sigma-54, partial [Deinococcus-Thermus bacterium]|nr:RNA polymerase factor sigma-54 [Deinococcota bacterium]